MGNRAAGGAVDGTGARDTSMLGAHRSPGGRSSDPSSVRGRGNGGPFPAGAHRAVGVERSNGGSEPRDATDRAPPTAVPGGFRLTCRNVEGVTAFSHDEGAVLRELVRRAKSGDGEAFASLYDRYAMRVYRFALARLGSPEAAEDLLQEVCLKVVEALPRYEERGTPFGAWLFRIARNAVIDHVRAATPSEPLDAVIDLHDDAPGPAELAELKGDAALLISALDRLTPEQRDVVVYRFFAGLSPVEIASVMDRREGTIRALQFRALGALRRHLDRAEAPGTSGGRDTDGRGAAQVEP